MAFFDFFQKVKFTRFKYFLAADSSLQFSKIQPALGWVGW
jgi:hypothetical protein